MSTSVDCVETIGGVGQGPTVLGDSHLSDSPTTSLVETPDLILSLEVSENPPSDLRLLPTVLLKRHDRG